MVILGSVAGDRLRNSNYIYGSSKKILDDYFSALRNNLHKTGLQFLIVKPGLVDTPMTKDFKEKGALWSKPKVVALDIIQAIENKKSVVYSPKYWSLIMFVIKFLPLFIMKRLNL